MKLKKVPFFNNIETDNSKWNESFWPELSLLPVDERCFRIDICTPRWETRWILIYWSLYSANGVSYSSSPHTQNSLYPSLRADVLLTAHSFPQCTAVFGLAGAEQLLKFNSKKFYLNISNAGEQTNYYRSRLRTLWNIKPRKK